MAASPRWKVYDRSGEYRGAVKYLEDAAALVAVIGDGTQIRDGHLARNVVWTEGAEGQSAGESYDYVCELAAGRIAARSEFGR